MNTEKLEALSQTLQKARRLDSEIKQIREILTDKNQEGYLVVGGEEVSLPEVSILAILKRLLSEKEAEYMAL